MRKILINERGEFRSTRTDYATSLAVKRLATGVTSGERASDNKEQVIISDKLVPKTTK